MANNRQQIPDEQRPAFGQSVPLGDTGDGNTGVPAGEQGISNRPGDDARELAAQEEDEEFDEDDEEDDEDDEEDDDLDDDEDEVTDPESEPGKPV